MQSALEIAQAVRERRRTPTEVVDEHLARIDELEPTLHAFQVVLRDEARAEAAALTDLDAPLAGVPVAIKDNVDVAGAPTRIGSAATPTAPAEHDDELVRRLRAAGCVVIGKTQMPELAVWPFTEPQAFAAPRNPLDHARTPGGSTGGGAVAVAAGMAALALGSDGGGSIRVPAACCGLVGIKPGPGVVPLAGGAQEHWYGMTEFGPLARTVADATAMLSVLAGRDVEVVARPRLRIAYSHRHPSPGAKPTRAVRAAFEHAVRTLADAGHELVEAKPPYPPDLGLRFSRRWLAGIAQDASRLDHSRLESRTRTMARRGRRGAKPAAVDPFGARVRAWFEEYDALLTPTLTRPAVAIGTWAGKGWVRTMLGVGNWLYTVPWNLARLPAASVPVGDEDGLPVGVQIVAPEGGEGTILSLAAHVR